MGRLLHLHVWVFVWVCPAPQPPTQVGGMWGGSPFCLTMAVTDSFTFAKLSEAQMLFEPGKMSAPRRSSALTYSKPLGSMAVDSGYCALGPFAFVLPSN